MTTDLHAAAPAGPENQTPALPRLELKPNIPTSAWVDGAWWPQTRDLAAELPPLLTALTDRVGTVAVVGYHLNAWSHAGPQLDTGSGTIILQGFTADDPQTILIIGANGKRVTLVVVPSATSDACAWQALHTGSDPAMPPPAAAESHADVAIDQSLEEVATRLASLDGRTDERTANIARWVHNAAQQFLDAPVQAFVPILVEHIVRQKLGPTVLRATAQERLIDQPPH